MGIFKSLIILLFFSLYYQATYAQDPNFTQFLNKPLYYNPGFAGINAGLDVNVSYRRLWPGIPGKFETCFISLNKSFWILNKKDKEMGLGGFGLTVLSDTEGDGYLKTISLGIPFSSRVKVGNRSHLYFGIMPSIVQKSVLWDELIFRDQLDPYYGIIYTSSFIKPDNSQTSFFDVSFGVVYEYEKPPGKNTDKHTVLRSGIAIFHATSPNQSFFAGVDSPLPFKLVIYNDLLLPISKKDYRNPEVLINPGLLFEIQGPCRSFNFGFDLHCNDLLIGIWYRNKNLQTRNTNAICCLVGYQYKIKKTNAEISYSYDFTLSKLSSSATGSHEITLQFGFEKLIFNREDEICYMHQKEKRFKKKLLKSRRKY